MKRIAAYVVSIAAVAALGAGSVSAGERPSFLSSVAREVRGYAEQGGPPASVVLIAGTIGGREAYGCAVIIAEQRSTVTMLTAAHNLKIERAQFITVSGERLRVEHADAIAGHDLALVTTSRPWKAYDVARVSAEPAVGTHVRVWGPIKDDPFTRQDAVVREIDPRATDVPDGAFALDCAACGHGDSGTGVFTARGELLGIVTASYSEGTRRLFVLGERYRPDATVASSGPAPH